MDYTEEEVVAPESSYIPVVVLKNVGDEVVGKYIRQDHKEGKYGPETHWIFLGGVEGKEFAINPNWDLKRILTSKTEQGQPLVKVGDMLRITCKGLKDLGQQNPMREFKVTKLLPKTPAAPKF